MKNVTATAIAITALILMIFGILFLAVDRGQGYLTTTCAPAGHHQLCVTDSIGSITGRRYTAVDSFYAHPDYQPHK